MPDSKVNKKISYQGEKGSYCELAAFDYFGRDISTFPVETFDLVFDSVDTGQCDYGIIPIENSSSGSIHSNYDLLIRNTLEIVGEHYLRIVHCLVAYPGACISDIRRIISHPQVLMECAKYIESLEIPFVAANDTASSVKIVRETGNLSLAAIASRHAAELYGMNVLVEGIEDTPENYTRFLIISRNSLASPNSDAKTSIVFTLKNTPGSLFKALSTFALRDIDLAKIESRPLIGKPWEYLFYLDFYGSTTNKSIARALENLAEYATLLRVFGSYRCKTPALTSQNDSRF